MGDIQEIHGRKSRLRAELRRKRRELSESYRQEADLAVLKRIEKLQVYRQARTVFCYVSVNDEVDTRKLIADMLAAGKCVAVPRCGTAVSEADDCEENSETPADPAGKKNVGMPCGLNGTGDTKGCMEAYEIKSLDDLEPGAYGIPEPKAYCGQVLPDEIDLCIVPCLCVGSGGTRLGCGGGYYDRYLLRIRPDAVCAALCREETQGEEPPAEPHDRPVDIAVTEKRVIIYGPDLEDKG